MSLELPTPFAAPSTVVPPPTLLSPLQTLVQDSRELIASREPINHKSHFRLQKLKRARKSRESSSLISVRRKRITFYVMQGKVPLLRKREVIPI